MNWNQLLLRLQFFTLLVSGFLCLCVWAGPNPGKLCPNGSTGCIRHHLLQRGLIRDDPRGKALRLSPGINLRWDFCSLLFNLFIFRWYYLCSVVWLEKNYTRRCHRITLKKLSIQYITRSFSVETIRTGIIGCIFFRIKLNYIRCNLI